MNDRDLRREERATRSLTFLTTNAGDFPPLSVFPLHRLTVKQLLEDLIPAKAGQRPDRTSKSSLLDALLLDFKRISATARAIELRSVRRASLIRSIRCPTASSKTSRFTWTNFSHCGNTTPPPWLKGGDTPEQKAAKAALRQRFLDLSIKSAFVTDLRHDRDAVDKIDERNIQAQQGGVENTAAISDILGKLSIEVDIMDAVVGNVYATQPERLHAWERASRIERDPKRGKKPSPPPADSPPPKE